jgi:hypothetical protein
MRLSDFQTAPVARNLEAERLVGVHARKVHRGVVDYRGTHIVRTLGSVECFGKDAASAVMRRHGLHTALDGILCKLNKTQDDGERLHRALDKLLDEQLGPEEEEEEPEESDDEEPEEGEEQTDEAELIEDDAEENEDPNEKVKIPYDSLSLDQLERTLNKTLGLDDGTNLSRATVMDAIKLGNPDDVASDAIAKFTIGFDVNKPAKIPWFGALRNWVAKYPQTAKVRDLHQPTLHKLLHELRTAA